MITAYYIGIMSGTSLDGVDAVLADFSSSSPLVLHTCYRAYDSNLRNRLLELHLPGYNELHRASVIGNELARYYAQAVAQLLLESSVKAAEVAAIGCHGQTVRHCPQQGWNYTIQLYNPALLVELTGITVVADFRSRDIAAGGQGAPLVPAFHKMLFSHPKIHRAIVNIGGISNITSLSPSDEVTGFDCGPGNIVMDAWCLRHTGNIYDNNGSWAASGKAIPALLEKLMTNPFFSLPPPKSAGREIFNLIWLESCLGGDEQPADVAATLLQLTAKGIADSVSDHFPEVTEVYLCGGGARNSELVNRIRAAMPGRKVELTDSIGVNADWLEAFAFAWLAKQVMQGIPGSLPSVTGARGARLLGAIYPNQ